jgi:hypothetical protein
MGNCCKPSSAPGPSESRPNGSGREKPSLGEEANQQAPRRDYDNNVAGSSDRYVLEPKALLRLQIERALNEG